MMLKVVVLICSVALASKIKQGQQVNIGEAVNQEQTTEKCEVEDACRLCSFKELQMIDACQESGYRLINKCVVAASSGEIIETTFIDRSCQAGTDMELIQSGEIAIHSQSATSVSMIFFVMFLLSLISYKVLDVRRSHILSEVYGKITILKK